MNNPLAFPRAQFNPQGVGYEDAGIGNEAQDGMTLRDYFAAKALQGLFALGAVDPLVEGSSEQASKMAYITADAMLKARDKV